MPQILLLRPAETDLVIRGVLTGRTDVDLNEQGLEHAQMVAERLSTFDISLVAVSPLRRAMTTAMYVCEHSKSIPKMVSGFNAADLGDWEQKTATEVIQGDGARFETWRTEPDFPCPGGE